jgi:hypothetical protein
MLLKVNSLSRVSCWSESRSMSKLCWSIYRCRSGSWSGNWSMSMLNIGQKNIFRSWTWYNNDN